MITRPLLAVAVVTSIAVPTTAPAAASVAPPSITATGLDNNDAPTPSPVPTRTPAPTDDPSIEPTADPSAEPTFEPPEGHAPYDPQDPDEDDHDPAAPEDYEVTVPAGDSELISFSPAIPEDNYIQSSLQLIDPETGETSAFLTVNELGRLLASPSGQVTLLPSEAQPGRWLLRYTVTSAPNATAADESEIIGRILITVSEPAPEPDPTPTEEPDPDPTNEPTAEPDPEPTPDPDPEPTRTPGPNPEPHPDDKDDDHSDDERTPDEQPDVDPSQPSNEDDEDEQDHEDIADDSDLNEQPADEVPVGTELPSSIGDDTPLDDGLNGDDIESELPSEDALETAYPSPQPSKDSAATDRDTHARGDESTSAGVGLGIGIALTAGFVTFAGLLYVAWLIHRNRSAH